MPGLAPYVNVLSANERLVIRARGNTVFIRSATGQLSVGLRSTAVGTKNGEVYRLRMVAAEEWNHVQEFDSVEIEDVSGAANTIEVYIGYGRFRKPVPDIVNVSTNVPASDTFNTPAAVDPDGSSASLILAANANRISVVIQADSSNDQVVRVGDSNVSTSRGIQLAAGEAITINSTAAIYAIEEAAGTNLVNILEETVA